MSCPTSSKQSLLRRRSQCYPRPPHLGTFHLESKPRYLLHRLCQVGVLALCLLTIIESLQPFPSFSVVLELRSDLSEASHSLSF